MGPVVPASRSVGPESAFRNLRIIHLAMSVALLVYGFLVFLMLSLEIIPREGFIGSLPLLRPLLWLAALGNFMAIDRIRSRFLTPEALRERARPVPQSILTWHSIMYALADGIAVYGVLLFFVAGLVQDFVALAGFAFAILYWLRPTVERYRTLMRDAGAP